MYKSFNQIIKGKNNIFFEEEEKKLKEDEEKDKKDEKKINFSENFSSSTLNIEYYQKYKSEVDYIYSFYKKISELQKEINRIKVNYIKNISNINSNFSFSFILKFKNE